jgi:hypothetical protein
MPSVPQSVTRPHINALSEVHRSAQRGAPALATVNAIATITGPVIGDRTTADAPTRRICPGGDRFETYERGCAQ